MSTSANLRSIYCSTITVFELKNKTDHRRKRFTLMSAIVTHATTWESNAYTALWTAFWMISQQYAYTVSLPSKKCLRSHTNAQVCFWLFAMCYISFIRDPEDYNLFVFTVWVSSFCWLVHKWTLKDMHNV